MEEARRTHLRARVTLTVEGLFRDASAEGVLAVLSRQADQGDHVARVRLLEVEGVEILGPGDEMTSADGSPHAFFDARPSLDALAAQQGVRPVEDFQALLGDFWPEDESADEFIAAVRAWRRDGA